MPATPPHTVQQRRQAYCAQGLHIERGLFSPVEISAILADVQGVLRKMMLHVGMAPPGAGEAAFHDAFVHLGRAHPTEFAQALSIAPTLTRLKALGTSPAMMGLVRGLGLTSPLWPTPPICYFLTEGLATPGGYHRAPPHQDWRYLQSSLDAITVWVPLVTASEATGVVELIPQSHRRGLLPTGSSTRDLRIPDTHLAGQTWLSPSLDPGDALIFSCLTVHRSGLNHSGRVRWAVAYRFANLDEPTFVARGMPNPYRFEPTLSVLTPDFPSPSDLISVFGEPTHD